MPAPSSISADGGTAQLATDSARPSDDSPPGRPDLVPPFAPGAIPHQRLCRFTRARSRVTHSLNQPCMWPRCVYALVHHASVCAGGSTWRGARRDEPAEEEAGGGGSSSGAALSQPEGEHASQKERGGDLAARIRLGFPRGRVAPVFGRGARKAAEGGAGSSASQQRGSGEGTTSSTRDSGTGPAPPGGRLSSQKMGRISKVLVPNEHGVWEQAEVKADGSVFKEGLEIRVISPPAPGQVGRRNRRVTVGPFTCIALVLNKDKTGQRVPKPAAPRKGAKASPQLPKVLALVDGYWREAGLLEGRLDGGDYVVVQFSNGRTEKIPHGAAAVTTSKVMGWRFLPLPPAFSTLALMFSAAQPIFRLSSSARILAGPFQVKWCAPQYF